MRSRIITPYLLPVYFFMATIGAGAFLLQLGASATAEKLGWIDALFTATSAVCVTGLSVVDTGTHFTGFGQTVILLLIQFGGLGIMTYTSLVAYLMGRKVAMNDRLAVGQTLLHDPSFKLGKFVMAVVFGTLAVECIGAILLWAMDPVAFHPYSALFHSISAFCNAGFSLFPDSLTAWRTNWSVSLVFMVLIIMGGLGFFVLADSGRALVRLFREGGKALRSPDLLSWHSRVVIKTSLGLIIIGALAIFFAEWIGGETPTQWSDEILIALFQSVTCRTAGFNTVEISHLTNVSLFFMLGLMLIGGSPGSCAGGIKTTTFRTIIGFIGAQFRGRDQIRIGRFALPQSSQHQAFTLLIFAALITITGCLILNISEGGDTPHFLARGHFLETLFEVISAFGTVGLSTGLTTKLTPLGKWVLIALMFMGRLGPVWLLAALQSWQTAPRYRLPEKELPMG